MASTLIPPLLEPYLTPRQPDLHLEILTGVLGASTNWLLLRYLNSYLAGSSAAASRGSEFFDAAEPAAAGDQDDGDGSANVLLVSFMRDYAFWRDGAAKMVSERI